MNNGYLVAMTAHDKICQQIVGKFLRLTAQDETVAVTMVHEMATMVVRGPFFWMGGRQYDINDSISYCSIL